MRSARANVLRNVPARCVRDRFIGMEGWRVWLKMPGKSFWTPTHLVHLRSIAWAQAWEKVQRIKTKLKQRLD